MARRKKQQHQTPHKWNIALYIRLSRDDGHDESLSITNQRHIIRDYLEQSFEGAYTIIDEYVDDGLSGTTKDDRVAFQRMIQDVEAGVVNCIVCKNLSRAFRNYADQGYFLEKVFPLHGTRFISLSDPAMDTYLQPEITQGMEVPITGLMNDRYAARTSNDIRRTFDMKRRKGEFIGAFAPYGYRKNPDNKNHLLIDEEAAQVVRDIYHWFVYEGMSKVGIAKQLNKLGVLTPTNYKHQKGLPLHTPQGHKNDGLWAVTTISTILQNHMYTGTMVQGKYRVISYKVHQVIQPPKEEWYVVENTHEPIIDQALFDKAQQIGKRRTRTAPTQKRVHLFSGFLRCADCGRSMTRKASRKQTKAGLKEYVYYVCSTYAFKSTEMCSRHSIKLEDLTAAVFQTIRTQISLVEDMASMIHHIEPRSIVDTQMRQLNSHQKKKHKEIETLEHVIDHLYIDWKSNYLSKTEYFRMKATFE